MREREIKMRSYAVGYLKNVEMGRDIETYLEAIDGTLALFGGRFVIHGGKKHMLEGQVETDLIVIEFPDLQSAQAWYDSAAYQAIIDYRRNNSDGQVFLIEGVDVTHKATDVLAA